MNRNQGKTWDRPTGGRPASGMRARGGCEALLKALAQPLHPSKLTKLCISCVPSGCSGRELPEVRALGKAVLSHGSFRSAWTATLLPPSPLTLSLDIAALAAALPAREALSCGSGSGSGHACHLARVSTPPGRLCVQGQPLGAPDRRPLRSSDQPASRGVQPGATG